ncbi:MAG: hypothetical protein OHK0022_43690 [Roseiflexaceae bacterium]
MPRVHIHVQDIEDIEELEDQEDWDTQIGVTPEPPQREARGPTGRGYRRIGAAEALDRKHGERRKKVYRGGKR